MTNYTLSEADSRAIVSAAGVTVSGFRTVASADADLSGLDYPVVAKLCGDTIAHKTERGLVRLSIADEADLRTAIADLLAAAVPDDGDVSVLISEMIPGNRELIAGTLIDPQFGPTVMLGVGGIFTEAIHDVVFRLAPISTADAHQMIDGIAAQALLDAFRGEPPVDRDSLAATLVALGELAAADPSIVSIDLNPLIVHDGVPTAVDALVERTSEPIAAAATAPVSTPDLLSLFEPRGIIVAGVSSHPGKFGFVALHNILTSGFEGPVFAVSRESGEVLGRPVLGSIDDVPDGAADLVFICTPASANEELLRQCAAKGVTAAFNAASGYSEAGPDGVEAERRIVELAAELGIVMAGPNGQGIVSTPVNLCAQIVAPNPPPGRIGVASQSGNFVSAFENLAVASGVGLSRAVSAGNAASTGVIDYLEWYADDPATAVGLVYLEGIDEGRALFERLRRVTEKMPVIALKGGATSGGQRAAASHTGALASDDAVFDGMCRQAGVVRAATVEDAFEAAATFATQPLPAGSSVAVMTTAGGWGVVTADAITASADLELAELAPDLLAAIDEKLPPRWSRNNPVDLAAGETRDTIPELIELIAGHDTIDSLIMLGFAIQSNQAAMMRSGRFYPGHGLERIVAFHERQDTRYATVAAEVSERTGKPILIATELATTDSSNAGVAAVQATGRLCYRSGNRAVTALGHLTRHATR